MYSQPGLYNMQLVMKDFKKENGPLKDKKSFSTTSIIHITAKLYLTQIGNILKSNIIIR